MASAFDAPAYEAADFMGRLHGDGRIRLTGAFAPRLADGLRAGIMGIFAEVKDLPGRGSAARALALVCRDPA